jgi:hypothetical protein
MTPATRKILTRHNASPVTEFSYYAHGIQLPILCRLLQHSKRTITEWLNGTRIIPTWAVAVLRLQTLEHELKLDEMGVTRDLDEPATKDHRREPAANADAYVINANAPAFHERKKTRQRRVSCYTTGSKLTAHNNLSRSSSGEPVFIFVIWLR